MTARPRTKHQIPEAGALCRLPATELAARIRRRELSVREIVTAFLDRIEAVNPEAVRYLNRLSDWLFVAARVANDNGRADMLWVPGATR